MAGAGTNTDKVHGGGEKGFRTFSRYTVISLRHPKPLNATLSGSEMLEIILKCHEVFPCLQNVNLNGKRLEKRYFISNFDR